MLVIERFDNKLIGSLKGPASRPLVEVNPDFMENTTMAFDNMAKRTASARKTSYGRYKALIVYDTGRTHQPLRRTFETRDAAVAYAKTWIEANERQRDRDYELERDMDFSPI